MKQLSWLKTKVGLFQDPRILYLLNQPNGDTYFVLWFFLKDLAGSLNDGGYVYVSDQEPLTAALIAKAVHRRRPFVEKALDVLERIDLIRRDRQGRIQILIWDDIQDYQKDEQRRQKTRQRVARYRERQKMQDAPQETAPQDGQEPSTLPDDGEVLAPEEPATAVTAHYIRQFGQIQALQQGQLRELAADWGREAVCRAIDIAHDNGVSTIPYIRAVLTNSNGQPQRRENLYARRERETDEYVDEMLRKSKELCFWEHP